jgi:hypothetical protein
MKECFFNTQRALALPDRWLPKWSEWLDIEENPDYEGCGIYQIRLVDPEGFPVNIPRFIDTDKEGILQICHSESIKRGIYRFRGATEGKNYTHAEGKRLQLLKKYTNFEERYKGCKLQYSFKRQPNIRKARVEQERLLKCYVKKYGEVPPNNNNFPDKHIDWESLRDSENIQAITFSDFIYPISFNLQHTKLTRTGGDT